MFEVPRPFVGRELLLDELDRIWAESRRDGGQCRILVHGVAGIGSTGLAAAMAERRQDAFPDGRLELQGPDRLRSALLQLGYPARELPDGEADQAAIYRLRTDGRKLLVVCDGITHADQVAHLVPNSPDSLVIATTRRRLRTLAVQGWTSVQVTALDQEASRALLRKMLAADFDTIDAATVSALLRTCGGHPLAIRVVGGVLAGQPEYASRLLAEMGEVGVNALEVDGVPLVLAVLDTVYEGLSDAERDAYRALAANPGPDFSREAAAVLLGADADRVLRSLIDANLLERGSGDRLGFHPLIRDHARLTARAEPGEFRERQHRIIAWYRDTGVHWESRMTRRWRESAAFPANVTLDPAERLRARRWLADERVNLESAVAVADDLRADRVAADLGFVLWTPLHQFGHPSTTIDAVARAADAARRLGDSGAVMQLTSQLGTAYFALDELDAADRHFAESLRLARQLRHGLGEQSALEWLGKIDAARAAKARAIGDTSSAVRWSDSALDRYARSEAIARTVTGEQSPRALALLALHRGREFNARSEFGAAAAVLPDAVRYFTPSGEGDNLAKVQYAFGRALLGLGDPTAARDRLRQALALFEADGSRRRQAETHTLLADADPDDAPSHRSAAETIYRELNDPRALGLGKRP